MFSVRWMLDEDWTGTNGKGISLVVTPDDGTLGTAMLALATLSGRVELLGCKPQLVSIQHGHKLNGVVFHMNDKLRRVELERLVRDLLHEASRVDGA